jgi:hypothetical protein
MKYPKMSDDIKYRIKEIRIKGKLGHLTKEDIKFCEKVFDKYGEKQYGEVISTEEVFKITSPNPLDHRG